MRRVSVVLQGGLGNQLFQVAWANYLERHLLFDVCLSVKLMEKQGQHGGVSYCDLIGSDTVGKLCRNSYSLILDTRMLSRALRTFIRLFGVRNVLGYVLYDYDALSPFSECREHSKNRIHLGYFQFVDTALISRVTFYEKIAHRHAHFFSQKSDRYSGRVAVHIRRGDFLRSSSHLHVSTSLTYIRQAMTLFPGRQFVIFSDDLRWCKDSFAGWPAVSFSEEVSAVDDFLAILCCSDYILSGSTFGWWAACVGSVKHENPKIVALEHEALFMKKEALLRLSSDVEVISK